MESRLLDIEEQHILRLIWVRFSKDFIPLSDLTCNLSGAAAGLQCASVRPQGQFRPVSNVAGVK